MDNNKLSVLEANLMYQMLRVEIPLRSGKVTGLFYTKKKRVFVYHCNICKSAFDFPEIKRPDAGTLFAMDIHGNKNSGIVNFCPKCYSTDIQKS